MTINKLIEKIEEEAENNSQHYMYLEKDNDICYVEGYGDALQYVLALIEED